MRRLLIGLCLLAVATAGVVRNIGPPSTASITPLPPGPIEVGERAQGTFRVGEHTVLVAADGITVSHPRSTGFAWASRRGRAFLVASVGTDRVLSDRGVLRVQDRVEQAFDHQVVDGADVDSDGRLVVTGELLDEEAAESVRYQLFFEQDGAAGRILRVSVQVLDDVDRLTWQSALEPGEAVHGLGEQFAPFDLRGGIYPIITREQGVGRGGQPLSLLLDAIGGAAGGRDTTYAPLPHYVTSASRSLWVRSAGVVIADLRSADQTAMTVWAPELEVVIGVGATPRDHVVAHARATGLMRSPPQWLDGGLVAGVHGGTTAVREAVAAHREAGVALAGVLVQDWTGGRDGGAEGGMRWSGTLDRDRYPEWEDLVADLEADGIRVLVHVAPMLSPDAASGAGRDLYAEARDRGHLVTGPDGQVLLRDRDGVDVAWVDLFDPAAADWMVEVLAEEALGVGASGFTADFGEGLPADGVTAEGSGLEVHNAYPTAWARVTRRALGRAGLGEEGLALHRSAGVGTAAVATMFWTGEQLVDFSERDGLPSALDGLLSGGMSGLALNHIDIGGHTSVVLPGPIPDVARTAELLVRSAELAAFTPMMRTEVGTRPGLGAQPTDPDVVEHLADLVDLYRALAPERHRLASDVATRGLPMVRHPLLVIPDQSDVARQPEVFFLGEDVFVAPVVHGGLAERTVTLPAGSWVDLWTGERTDVPRNAIGEMTVPAALGRPPAWARADSPVADDLEAWRRAG